MAAWQFTVDQGQVVINSPLLIWWEAPAGFDDFDSATLDLTRWSPTGYSELLDDEEATVTPNVRATYAYLPTAVGTYTATFTLTKGETAVGPGYVTFECVDPSGDNSGTHGAGRIIEVQDYELPEVNYVVWETVNGDLVARSDPS
jgi:hypothetical protein